MYSHQKALGLHNCGYYNASFLREVERELQSKAIVVRAGCASFSKADLLAYKVLESQGFFKSELEDG